VNRRADLVPLLHRAAALQGTRVVLGAVVVLAVQLPAVTGRADQHLAPLAIGYVAATGAVELVRRLLRRRALPVVSGMLLVDGAFLAVVVAETGGSASPLLFLVHVHVVAAAVLATFRSGVVVAIWHGLLLVAAGYVTWVGDVPDHPAEPELFAIASFLLVGTGAVAVARLNERALRRSRWAAASLVELGSRLERSHRSDGIAIVAAEHLVTHLGYRRAAVVVAGAGDRTGAVADDRGAVPVVVAGAASLPIATSDPLPVRHLDVDVDPALATLLPGACNVVVTTLVADGKVLGVLAVECGPDRPDLALDELDLLVASGERVALALRAAELLAEVERLATCDPLTGLANRRLFDETLAREVARSRRTGAPLALAVVDIDHFKAVNDGHGHQVGDEVLRELATALHRVVRTEDLVARFGGEEFVVLATGATVDDAEVLAERLRAAARSVSTLPVTISVGVAELPTGGDGATLVAHADAALYRAKAEGRDRVVRHDAVLDLSEPALTGAESGR
jgi:two-component system, cell cycle response regulator